MSKLKCQRNVKVQILKIWHSELGIHLTFACLREAASAEAGILTFELLSPS